MASDGREALGLLRERAFDVILLDVVMPGMDGLSTMKKLREDSAAPAIIVLTGKATVETAVEAMKNGAFDYLTKPYKLDELVILVNRAHEYGQLSVKNRLLEQELVRQESPVEFVGRSRQLREILALIRKVAPTDSPVLIQGESGTGKELVANTLWQHSRRCASPFIPLNCATFSESLIESELFGHEKGAFTGAIAAKHGLVEVADKGTLFLDEIGEMPLALQPKLLRFLDAGEYRRVGGTRALSVDVRVIAATNRDLRGMIAAGRFREDLSYRLNVITITIPPLRERAEDIPDLARHFLDEVQPQDAQAGARVHPRGAAGARALRLAGQRPGARERRRAGGDPLRRRSDRPGGPRRPGGDRAAGRRQRKAGHRLARGDRARPHPARAQGDRGQPVAREPAARHRPQDALPQAQEVRPARISRLIASPSSASPITTIRLSAIGCAKGADERLPNARSNRQGPRSVAASALARTTSP